MADRSGANMLAWSACPQSGPVAEPCPAAAPEGGPAGQLGHQERHAPAQRGEQPDQLGRGFGDVAADERRGVAVAERAEPELGRAVPVDEAAASGLQRARRRYGPVREHDAHPLAVRRPGEVVQQPQAAVVGVVDVVDGEQQAPARRGQADQFGRGQEERLMCALPGPRDRHAVPRPVDLFPVPAGQAGEQRRILTAHAAERLDDRGVRPRSLDRDRGSVAGRQSQLRRPGGDGGQQRRFPRPGLADDDQRAAPPGRGVEQGPVRDGEFQVTADQRVVAAREHAGLGEQPVPQCRSLRAWGDAELLPQRTVQALELAQRGMPVAVRRVLAHEGQVGALVARVEFGHRRPATVQPQQVQVTALELLAARLGPLLVPVPRQQFAAVQRERLAGHGGVPGAERLAGQLLELDRVHGHAAAGAQDHLVAAQHHRVWHPDGAPGEVRRLVQLGYRLGDRVLRPDQVDDLLAMQPPARRQGEHLHHRRRVPALPAGVDDGDSADRHGEPAEQRDVDLEHQLACRRRPLRPACAP